MGQRHQAFLIARISTGANSGRYKCVAAFHHQWCYGRLPLRAVRRFLTLAKQPTNAAIIREELRRISETDKLEHSHYLSSLLACAFNFGLEESDQYVSGPHALRRGFLPATMGCWDDDNDDGLSVIDITDPEHGAYCFLHDSNKPLTSEAYARIYYPDDISENNSYRDDDDSAYGLDEEEEKDVVNTIQSLAGEPLINLEDLAETWPMDFQTARGGLGQAPSHAGAIPTKDPVSEFVPSLVDLTLVPSIQHALAENDTEPIENILWMPGKAKAVLDVFKSTQFDRIPNIALPLLKKVVDRLSNENELDVSYLALTDDQLLSIIGERKDLRVLDLSYNKNVTIKTIETILSNIPGLRRLVLFDAVITEGEWDDLLTNRPRLFYNLESLIHRCFYEADEPFYPCAFAFVSQSQLGGSTTSTAVLPFFTPTIIVEALSQIFVSQRLIDDVIYRSSLVQSAIGPVALSHEVLRANQPWGERSIPFFAPPIDRTFDDTISFHPSPIRNNKSLNDSWIFYRRDPGLATAGIGFVKREVIPKDSATGLEDGGAKEPTVVVKVFDLAGFLSEMEKEGRPKASEDAVKTLTEAFAKLTNNSESPLPSHSFSYEWLTQENAKRLFGRR